MSLTDTQEAHRLGAPHWMLQTAAAEADLAAIKYLVNDYNMHIDSAQRSRKAGDVGMKKIRIVDEE